MRLVILEAVKDGRRLGVRVYGPYTEQEASDAVGLLRGLEFPVGLEIGLGVRNLEDPATLEPHLRELGTRKSF